MILMIDNYDSFTYNLYQQLGEMYPDINVVRNDAVTIEEIEAMKPEAIILSPGPGTPKDAGICVDVVKHFTGKLPILGICLGEQSIGEAFGGKVVLAHEPLHGKMTPVRLKESPIFEGLPPIIEVGRYHSLIVERDSLPNCLEVIAEDYNGQIMALRHKYAATYGIQFHPESVLTAKGAVIAANFLRLAGIKINEAALIKIQGNEKADLKKYIAQVVEGKDLSQEKAEEAMNIIMKGRATDSQVASFITALRIKGETIEEITGCAKAMRANAARVSGAEDAIDIVGTGGDEANTFNISTTSAFVIAGCGQRVAKHGNRSVSSKSGAADVLECLGVKITSTPEKAKETLDKCGLSFLFAQSFHGSMRFAGPARRETGIRSVFNILGPLCNPAFTDYIVMGCYDGELLRPLCEVLKNLGLKRAMVVHGSDGLDEITVSGITNVCELKADGEIVEYTITPADFGLGTYEKTELVGGTAAENAEITKSILGGGQAGAKRDIVLLNSACALYITGKADSILDGVRLAAGSIDGGAARKALDDLVEASNA
ncbi:MAG: bifunctional anthranilate synthase component II/anthranilate phosphoribosyltransferase [Oscillospiraceae bacterium]|nr:bifunctional anthranilate synthase component II/anthranilate phosphoribosyltransferase [Oscillospiraceae bacterium]